MYIRRVGVYLCVHEKDMHLRSTLFSLRENGRSPVLRHDGTDVHDSGVKGKILLTYFLSFIYFTFIFNWKGCMSGKTVTKSRELPGILSAMWAAEQQDKMDGRRTTVSAYFSSSDDICHWSRPTSQSSSWCPRLATCRNWRNGRLLKLNRTNKK